MPRLKPFVSTPAPAMTISAEELEPISLSPLYMAKEETYQLLTRFDEFCHQHHLLNNMTSRLMKTGSAVAVETIQLTQITTESICKKLGLEDRPYFPALECFTNKYEKKIAFNVAVEGLWDALKAIWRSIKNFIKSMWEKIKAFFRQFFDLQIKLTRKVASLKERVKELDNYPFDCKFKDSDIYEAFCIKNRMVNANVVSVLENHSELTSDIDRLSVPIGEITEKITIQFNTIEAVIERILKPVEEQGSPGNNETPTPDLSGMNSSVFENHNEQLAGMTHLLNVDTQRSDVLTLIDMIKTTLVQFLQMKMTSNTRDGIIAVSNKSFLNGKYLELTQVIDEDRVDLGIDIVMPDPVTIKDLTVLTKSEMSSILAQSEKLLKQQDIIQKSQEKLDKATNRLHKFMDESEKILDHLNHEKLKAYTPALMQAVRQLASVIQSVINIINKVYTEVPSLNLKAVQQAVRFVELSADRYVK